MGKPLGYNPMRWNCASQGCYNDKLRPRIEEFAGCFPNRISMSDVDGIAEVGGRFLLLEWKAPGGSLQTGQRIMYERMTQGHADPDRFTVIIVFGDPKSMAIVQHQVVARGKIYPAIKIDLATLKQKITAWADRARHARHRPSRRGAA